jgi:hypothetical protein
MNKIVVIRMQCNVELGRGEFDEMSKFDMEMSECTYFATSGTESDDFDLGGVNLRGHLLIYC